MTHFSRYLLDGRKHKKMSQQEVADKAGIKKHDLINLESGRYIQLPKEAFLPLAIVADMDPDMLEQVYYSDFQSEIRKKRAAAQKTDGEVTEDQELSALGKSIRALPKEKRAAFIQSISLMLNALSAEPA